MDFAAPHQKHSAVTVTEVGTRDGFQAEARFIDTAIKAEIIDAMIAAGVRHIEATSFVSPRAVPQLADAHELLCRLTLLSDAELPQLYCSEDETGDDRNRRDQLSDGADVHAPG
jgi:isopropylmalate/homocitrate/citramalate synthase